MTQFNFNATARSRMAMSSAFCCAVVRPDLDGQQELPTVAIHAARNSRAGGGGRIFSAEFFSSAANKIAGSKNKIAAENGFLQFMRPANETRQSSFWQRFSVFLSRQRPDLK